MLNTASLYFLTVAQCGSFTKAAQTLYVSQSAISKQIAAFEAEIGEQLLVREHRLIRLTPTGRAVYETLLHAQQNWNTTLSAVQSNLSAQMPKLRVGIPPGWSILNAPMTFFTQFEKSHPEIACTVEQHPLANLIKLLLAQKLDVILTPQITLPANSMLTSQLAFCAHIIVYLSIRHPLAASKIPPANYADIPGFVVGEECTEAYLGLLSDLNKKHGWNMAPTLMPNMESLYTAVDQCKGCGVGTTQTRALLYPRYRCYHYDDFVPAIFVWNIGNFSASTHVFLHEFFQWLPKDTW